jgi:hypothetical protein
LEHLKSSVKELQEALGAGYKMALRVAWSDMLRKLEDFRVTFVRVVIAGYWKAKQKKY